MPADRAPLRPDRSAATREQAASVAVVTALGVEAAPLESQLRRRAGASSAVYRSGPGAERAARCARAALTDGAVGLVSWGLAGGLATDLAPGVAVLPARVLLGDGSTFTADPYWREAIAASLGSRWGLDGRDLLAVDHVLATPQDKARAAAGSGAAAADMESGAIARVAAAASVPFVVLRVIVDSATDTLPPGVERWVDAHGRARVAPALDAALKPAHWHALLVLTRRYRVARRTLASLSRELVAINFAYAARAPHSL